MGKNDTSLKSIRQILNTEFTEDNLKKFESCINTGFEELNRMLNGGLRAGINIIGAVPSIGKTTFALQLACNIAMNPNKKERVPVLYFALEESAAMLAAKAICRAKFEADRKAYLSKEHKDHLKSEREAEDHYSSFFEILNSAKLSEWEELKKDISGRGDLLRIYDRPVSAEDIVRIVEAYISRSDTKPLVIVDYFQIMKEPNLGFNANSKQIADKNLEIFTQLKEKDIPLLLISSLNRANYNKPIGLESFKESGGIEYSADLLLGLQFSAVHKLTGEKNNRTIDDTYEKSRFPRRVEIITLKNRYGSCGKPVKFKFYAPFYYFEETEDLPFEDEDEALTEAGSEADTVNASASGDASARPQSNTAAKAEISTAASLSLEDEINNNSYMNNTKIANEIRKGLAKIGEINRCRVSGKDVPPTYTKYTVSSALSGFDCDVADAVYSVFIRNRHRPFTPGDILHELSGNGGQRLTPQKEQAIKASMEKLMKTDITIDCAAEMKMRKINSGEPAQFKGKFLDASYDRESGKYSLTFRSFERSMPLYGYGAMNHQMIRFPHGLLDTTEFKLEDTNEIISIKRFLIRKIEILANSKSNKTLLKTMFKELSITKDPAKFYGRVEKILESFRKKGYIKKYAADTVSVKVFK